MLLVLLEIHTRSDLTLFPSSDVCECIRHGPCAEDHLIISVVNDDLGLCGTGQSSNEISNVTSVEPGYNVMEGTEYFVHLKPRIITLCLTMTN